MLGALGLLTGVLLGSGPAGDAPLEVHTATRDVRDCQALDHGAGYLAATDGGVVWVDEHGLAATPLTLFDGLPETRAYVIEPVAGSTSAWWVGTEGGLAKLERSGGRLRVTASWRSAPVRAVLEYEGRTWVGTWGDGVLELDGTDMTPVAGPGLARADRISSLVAYDGEVVAASAGAGAWVVTGSSPTRLAGVEGVVWSLAVHDGSLYAGTLAGVLEVRGGLHDSAADRATMVSNADARALASVDDELWIGSRGQGLLGIAGVTTATPRISHVQGFDRDRCIATPDGLWIHARQGWTATLDTGLPAGDVTAMLQVGDALWVGTFEHGLAVYRDGAWHPVADPEHALDPQINALADAGDGRVWVATTRGLHRVGDAKVESWTTKTGLPHANVLSLAPLVNGELLVGTHAGVAIVDADGDLRSLGHRARSWATWAVAEGSDGELWFGTTQGLIQWQPDGTWNLYSMLSGHLEDNWVTALRVEGTTLDVGTYAGGVTRMRSRAGGRGTRWDSEPLGGGRVNPGGLSVVHGQLVTSTMKGALVLDGGNWRTLAAAPFEDVTQVLETGAGVWISSRRGLALHGATPSNQ